VRVRASAALAGVHLDSAELVLTLSVENHASSPVFIRHISLELVDKQALFFQRDYLTRALNTRRELRAGESYDFHVSLRGLFGDGRTPAQFLGVFAVDDLNRTFRFDGEAFNKIVEALYTEHVRVTGKPPNHPLQATGDSGCF
jgi:hypothetical protein